MKSNANNSYKRLFLSFNNKFAYYFLMFITVFKNTMLLLPNNYILSVTNKNRNMYKIDHMM